MRLAVTLALAVLAATPAHAEVTRLGGYRLGQKLRRPRTVKKRLFGCAGTLHPSVDRKKKVVKVRFSTRRCKAEALAAAITKRQRRRPIVNAQGDKLWEGKTASIILSTARSTKTMPILLLVPPGPGAKRTCWPGDGFARFWSRFKAAVTRGDPARIAASFVFPAKDYDGEVLFANRRAFTTGWTDVIDQDDASQIAAGKITPTCRVDGDRYKLFLESTYVELTATRVKRTWRWSAIGLMSTN